MSGFYTNIKKAQNYYSRFGFSATIVRMIKKITRHDYRMYMTWYKRNRPTDETLKQQRKQVFEYQPKISIVIPLFKTPERYLQELVQSVKKQTYSKPKIAVKMKKNCLS